MKKYLGLLILLMVAYTYGNGQSLHFKDRPMTEVLDSLQKKYDVNFSYKDNHLANEKVDLTITDQVLDSILIQLFTQSKLNFIRVDKNYYTIVKKDEDSKIFYCGFVKSSMDSTVLVGAHVKVNDSSVGATTNVAGQFNFEYNGEVDDIISISYIGYSPFEINLFALDVGACPTLYLSESDHHLETVVVKEYLTDGIEMRQGGNALIINPKRLGGLPGLVEPDVFASVQLLPGVLSVNETASALNIRGGTPDQNLILFDGIPIYHTGHMFGMISAFNSSYLSSVDVYRSAVSSRFGGRASGVIDMTSDTEVPKKWSGNVALNMTHFSVDANVPLWKNSGLQISARSNVSQTLSTPTFRRYAEKVFQGTRIEFSDNDPNLPSSDKMNFSDFHFHWLWKPGKSTFSASIFTGGNNLDNTSEIQRNFISRDLMLIKNTGLQFSWKKKWSEVYTSELSLYNSDYSSDYSLNLSLQRDVKVDLGKITRINNVNDDGVKWTNSWRAGEAHSLLLGYEYSAQDIRFGIKNELEDPVEKSQELFSTRIHALFGEYILTNDLITFNAGLRYEYEEKERGHYFSPRMSVHAKVNEHLELKLSTGKQFQFVSQLTNLDLQGIGIGVGNELWVASDHPGIPVIESTNWAAGIIFQKNDWAIDVEGYVKELSGLTTLSGGFQEVQDQPFSTGDARVRGIDILAKKRMNHWRSWVSYTLANAVYEFPALNEQPFPAGHDVRHAFQWINTFERGRWLLSMRWQWRSGLPFTQAIQIDTMYNNSGKPFVFVEYEDQHKSRLAPYHRLDASVIFKMNQKGRVKTEISLGLLNIYNRQNELGRNFLLDQSRRDEGILDLIRFDRGGLKFTPNLGVRMRW